MFMLKNVVIFIRTKKKLDNMTNEALLSYMQRFIDRVKADLGISKGYFSNTPCEYEGTVMETVGFMYKDIENTASVVKTETEGEIRVNFSILRAAMLQCATVFADRKAALYCLQALVAHEMRHIWQYETGEYFVGFPTGVPGEEPEEKDANEYAIRFASGKAKVVAKYLKLLQECTGFKCRPDPVKVKALVKEYRYRGSL